MMDKIIKQKLGDYKAPFHEPDWLAMEKLLDQKTKKPFLLAWWKSGIAAAFLLGSMITFAVYQTTNSSESTSAAVLSAYRERLNTKFSITEKLHYLPNTNYNNSISNKSESKIVADKHVTKNSTNTIPKHQLNNSSKNIANSNTILANNGQSLATLTKQEELQSLLPMNIMLSSLEESNFNSFKSEETILVHKSRKLVQYSLIADVGALANIKLETSSSSKSFNVYSDVFSDVGLSFQCLFIKKIGIYTGVKYADRKSFSSPDSMTVGPNNVLLNSKSKVEGINIPIGIIANIYEQKYLCIYTKVGLNNIFPIRETIDFQTIDKANEPPIEKTTTIGNTKFIASADNNVSVDKQNVSYSLASPIQNKPENHSIKQKTKEKYLAELQFALGLKIKANAHLAFSFEPAYLLDLKNSNRPSNGSNFSINTGIIYSF